MNKKLIVLMLLLPLLLMLSIFTSTRSASLNVKIAVGKIEISGENLVYLNIEQNEKYLVNYSVYPLNATNKQVAFTTEKVGSEPLAELEFEEGYIIPKSVGMAKVNLTTVDGGFKDSFIIKVESKSLISIESSVSKNSIMVGETLAIATTFNPTNYGNQLLNYTSSDNSIVSINQKGELRGEGRGTATITISSDVNSQIKDEITITVYNKDVLDISQQEMYVWNDGGSINLSVDSDENYVASYKVYDEYNIPLEDVFDEQATRFVDLGAGRIKFEYAFQENFIGTIKVEFSIEVEDVVISKQCVMHKVDKIEATLSDEELYCNVGGSVLLHRYLTILPEDADVSCSVKFSNSNLTLGDTSNNKLPLNGVKPGVTNVELTITNRQSSQSITLKKEVVVLPDVLLINEQQFSNFGIENIFTVGKTEADGTDNISKISVIVGPNGAGDNFWENFSFYTDNENVEVKNDGTIKILNENFTGLVNIVGKFEYGSLSKDTTLTENNVKKPYQIRCVGSGVNVRNFEDLYNATNANKIVVLQGDIVKDFGKINGSNIYSESTVTKIQSTYDTTHYANLGKLEEAKIKILINFKADVYGNGYIISSHNVAYGLDSTGNLKTNALFRGPINFVSMTDSGSSMVSVKGQDNVSFAVYEGVTLNNVELKSYSPEDESEISTLDLNDLTYVGTTVEVFGDDVNIEYCRINNGRTVLRAFGDINDRTKVINVNIKNSVLSCAREFIIRMGSNFFVDGTTDNPSPYLDENTTLTIPAQNNYSKNMTPEEKAVYDSKYIKTFVNLKNSILQDSGLFSIGIDTHFSGLALADGKGFLGGAIESWKDLAKTSYGAKLTLEGDVRIYDWKEVSSIDSSTLIEIQSINGSEGKNEILEKYESLNFDVKELIQGIAKNEYLNTIVYTKGEKQYVHGGIAFFGGGKNYGVVDYKNYEFKTLNGYSIKLSDVNKSQLQVAAGNESFYFLLNDSTTAGFTPEDQENILKSASANDPIYK